MGKRLIMTEFIYVVLQTYTYPVLETLSVSPDLLRSCLGLYHFTPSQLTRIPRQAKLGKTPTTGVKKTGRLSPLKLKPT